MERQEAPTRTATWMDLESILLWKDNSGCPVATGQVGGEGEWLWLTQEGGLSAHPVAAPSLREAWPMSLLAPCELLLASSLLPACVGQGPDLQRGAEPDSGGSKRCHSAASRGQAPRVGCGLGGPP